MRASDFFVACFMDKLGIFLPPLISILWKVLLQAQQTFLQQQKLYHFLSHKIFLEFYPVLEVHILFSIAPVSGEVVNAKQLR